MTRRAKTQHLIDAPQVPVDLPSLADEVRACHAAVRDHIRSSFTFACRAGELLLTAKRVVGHGRWLNWIDQNCHLSEDQVERYIRCAKHRAAIEANSADVRNLTITEAMKSIARPREPKSEPHPEQAAEPESPQTPAAKPVRQAIVAVDVVDGDRAVVVEVDAPSQPAAPTPGAGSMPGKTARGRAARWREAAARALAALEDLQEVQSEYQSWADNLPESLQNGSTSEKLQAVIDIDIASAVEVATEAEGADLPLGFGRD
jgi:hypothetical protein